MTLIDFAVRLLVALALGCAIGIERQYRQRMAGLRTNALVAVGSALFVVLSAYSGGDPTRVAAQVVSGIGFLAGGVIFREGLSVRGLNTAATLWATAAVGTLAGMGFTVQAAFGALAVLGANMLLRPIVRAINIRSADGTEIVATYELRAVCREPDEDRVRAAMITAVRAGGLSLHAVSSEDIEPAGRVEVVADVAAAGRPDARLERIISRVGVEPGVSAISWKMVPADDDEHEMLPEA